MNRPGERMSYEELFERRSVNVSDLKAAGYSDADHKTLWEFAEARRAAGLPTITTTLEGEPYPFSVQDGRLRTYGD